MPDQRLRLAPRSATRGVPPAATAAQRRAIGTDDRRLEGDHAASLRPQLSASTDSRGSWRPLPRTRQPAHRLHSPTVAQWAHGVRGHFHKGCPRPVCATGTRGRLFGNDDYGDTARHRGRPPARRADCSPLQRAPRRTSRRRGASVAQSSWGSRRAPRVTTERRFCDVRHPCRPPRVPRREH